MKTPFQCITRKCAGTGMLIAFLSLSQGAFAQTSYNLNSIPVGGTGNVGIGGNVLVATTGSYNVAAGYLALRDNTAGLLNVGVGYGALSSNLGGNSNTAVGQSAMALGTTASGATAVGANSLAYNNGAYNTAVGINSLGNNSIGIENTAVGAYALLNNTTSRGLTAMGYFALYSNTTGTENSAFGRGAMNNNLSGSNNVAVGHGALYANTSGANNTALGHRALTGATTGGGNTAVGQATLLSLTTGTNNTGLGFNTNVAAGNLTNATAVGYNTVVNASNKIRLGSAAVTVVEGPVAYTVSDGRFKTHVREDDVKGLAFIQELRPVVYNFETRALTEFLTQDMPDSVRQHYLAEDFQPSTAIRQSGFIAQEVEAAAKAVGYDFNGVAAPTHKGDNYSLAYGQFVVPLVKGMQEQQAMIAQRDAEVAALKAQLVAQQAQIAELSGLVHKLADAAGAAPSDKAPVLAAEQAILVFPNPSQGRFTLRIPADWAGVLQVTDMRGRSVLRQTLLPGNPEYQLDLTAQPKGSYLLQLEGRQGSRQTEKLVIE